MALNPNYLDSLPNTLVNMYSLVEIDILEDMARRISTYDFFIPSALHQNQKLQELGMVQDDIIKALSAMTGQTQQEIVSLLTEAGEVAIEDDVEYYKAADVYKPDEIDTEALYKQLNSGLLQTQQAFKNITRTTANTATKQFENALDRAWTQINVGGMDYNTAIHRAIKDLSQQGIGAIAYKSGRVDSIEVAVRRAIVTGANQTAAKTQEVLADELGVDLVEVTAHGGARPEHAKWQGKVYSRHGRKVIDGVVYEDFEKATRYGHGDGLGGWNCRHNFHPYVHGAPRTWTDEQIKALDKKSIEYNGEKYTEYEASQIQRGIERDIRRWKREFSAMKAANLDTTESAVKIRSKEEALKDFVKQTKLKNQQARTQAGDFGKKEGAEASAGAREYYNVWAKSKNIKNSVKTLANYYEIKYNNKPRYELLQKYVNSVDAGKLSPLSGFELYEEYHNKIETEIVGKKVDGGITITGQTQHFLERVFGTMRDPKNNKTRNGVGLEDIKETLSNPTHVGKPFTRNDGKRSIVFYGKNCGVTVNPDTGELVQTNPLKG